MGKTIHWEFCKILKFDHTNEYETRNRARNNPQTVGKGSGKLLNQRTREDHLDNCIIE